MSFLLFTLISGFIYFGLVVLYLVRIGFAVDEVQEAEVQLIEIEYQATKQQGFSTTLESEDENGALLWSVKNEQ